MVKAWAIPRQSASLAAGGCALAALAWVSRWNFPLFHTLAELFSIVVAAASFMLAWNARRFLENSYLLFLGIAYLFVGSVDLLHTLTYKGLGVLQGLDADTATQLWILGRYIESACLLVAPVFLVRTLRRPGLAMGVLAGIAGLALTSIFWPHFAGPGWLTFPTCYVEGEGFQGHLTPFKVFSEYAICALLLGSLVLLLRHRGRTDRRILALVSGAIVVTILSELAFALYADVFGLLNMAGHLLKIISFYLVYKAVIATGLTRPYQVLFGDLTRSEQALRATRDELEKRVQERTADLHRTVGELAREVVDRTSVERQLEAERQTLFSVLQTLPGYVALWSPDRTLRFANERFRQVYGPPDGRGCHEVFFGQAGECKLCQVACVAQTRQEAEWELQGPRDETFRVWGYPFTDTDGTELVLVLGIEITEQKRLEAEVLRTAEMERRSIGQDLHDSLGQTLSGVSCLSQVLRRKLADLGLPEAEDAARIESYVVDALDLTRSLARGLNPVGDQPDSLMVALRDLAANVEAMFAVRCSFRCAEPVLVGDGGAAMHLYRIAQEAVNNAVRHGKAGSIRIDMAESEDSIVLTVRDDGVGIPAEIPPGQGLGLRIMRYRAERIWASLAIGPDDDGGTVVTCRAPRENSP